MYFFLFDSFTQESKYRNEVARIEARIGSLGIQGRSEKMTILKNIREAAERAAERGATTIVAVGNDQTVSKILPVVAGSHLTLGHIPLGESSRMGDCLGLPSGAAACDDVSRRIIEKIDVGKAGSQYFLLSAELPPSASLECDGAYTISATSPEARISVVNLGNGSFAGRPADGRIEVVIEAAGSKRGLFSGTHSDRSVFPVTSVKIPYLGPNATVTLDDTAVIKTPMTIEVLPQSLSVIVGGKRKF